MREYALGRIQSPFDARDYNLADFIPLAVPMTIEKNVYWDFPSESLNQGLEPSCVGYTYAAFGITTPVNTMYTNEDGDRFYRMCKEIDGMPNSEGTTLRAGAKIFKREGRIKSYAFARDINAIKWWLFNRGSVVVGTLWSEEMFYPNRDNIITIGGSIVGGHAYLIREIKDNKYFGIQNSWGKDWGTNGKAYISIEDFDTLFSYNGEAVTTVELEHGEEENIKPPKSSHKCWLLEFIKDVFR